MLPFASAQSVVVRSYGDDKVFNPNTGEGYITDDDALTIEAVIDVPNVAPSQVVLVDTGQAFTSCTTEGSISTCKLIFPREGFYEGGSEPFSVRYASGGAIPNTFYVDILEPEITSLTARQTGIANVTASYSAVDQAYDGGTTCAGFKKVEYTLDGVIVKTVILNLIPGNCNYNAIDSIPAAGSTAGTKELCVVVYDSVGNQGELCTDVFVDNTVPVARNLEILDAGKLLTHVAPSRIRIPAQFKFTVVEDNLTFISADLSDFTEVVPLKQNFVNQQVVCSPVQYCNGTCTCTASMDIQLSAPGTYTARITAQDSSGLSTQIPLSYQILIDAEKPVAQSIEAYNFNGINYIGPGYNIIKAAISESGSGFTRKNVFLDLSGIISAEYPTTPPTECTKQAANWLCEWRGVTTPLPNGASRGISIVHPSQDDAGNLMQGQEATIVVDKQSPVINNSIATAFSLGGQSGLPASYIRKDDAIRLVVYVNETLPVKAFADFRGIAGTKIIEGNCANPVNGFSRCEWQPFPGDTGPARAGIGQNIPIRIVDAVGNNLSSRIENIDVYEVVTGPADFWIADSGDASPSVIDREMVRVYSPFAFQQIDLLKKQSVSAYPVSISVANCAGDSSYLERPPEIIDSHSGGGNDVSGVYTVYVRYPLARTYPVPPDNDISITCTLNIISKVGGNQLSLIEQKNVTAKISYYNNPLGELSSEVLDAIGAARNKALFKATWIDDAQKVIDGSKAICGVVSSVYATLTAFAVLSDVFKACILSPAFVSCLVAGKATGKTVGKLKDGVGKIYEKTQKFCKVVQCRTIELFKEGSGYRKLLDDVFIQYGGVLPKIVPEGPVRGKLTNLTKGSFEPEDSLITSIIYLCPSGIVYNLEKARQVQCQYINCLLDGYPKFVCDRERTFMNCKWWVGTVFNAIPFATAISQLGQNLGKIFANPFTLIPLVFDSKCKSVCKLESLASLKSVGDIFCSVCSAVEFINIINDVKCDLFGGSGCGTDGLKSKFKSIKGDICSDVEKRLIDFDAKLEEEGG